MQKNPYRTLMIWVVVVVGLVNIYPTIGWMTLEDDVAWLSMTEEEREGKTPAAGTRQARLAQWAAEDDDRAKTRLGYFEEMSNGFTRWKEFDRDKVITLGLDLQGGVHMVLGVTLDDMDPEKLAEYRSGDFPLTDAQILTDLQESILQQIRRRVNEFEAREPVIQALGADKIQVQLAGERDIQRALGIISRAFILNFHIAAGVDETVPVFEQIKAAYPDEFTPFIQAPTLRGDPFRVPLANYNRVKEVLDKATAQGGIVPAGKMIAFSQRPKPFAAKQEYELYLLDTVPIQTGEGLTAANALPDQTNPPNWLINFTFNAGAGANFGKVTEANLNRSMAIVVDGSVISAPTINGIISTNGQITGNFDAAEAKDLSIALNSGSMDVKPTEEYTGVVGATLGADSVKSGVTSAVVGIVLVGVFMLFYYLAAGIIALFALALNAVLVVAAMAYFNMTLTLPGIAGLILTVGMAVDANVLIFERIREELRLGHSLLSSIESGFKKATITILDANVTTLIAAAVLMEFGTGPIEGFAITLSVGVCASVFTALIVSRALFDFAVGQKLLKKLTMLSLIKGQPKIPFLSGRAAAGMMSAIFIVIGIGIFAMRGSDNFGVDFTEGTNAQIALAADAQVPDGDLRSALSDAGFENPSVKTSSEGESITANSFLIRVGKTVGEGDGETSDAASVSSAIQAALAPLTSSGTAADVTLNEVQTVGPAVGQQLRRDAVLAIVIALFFIVCYLTLRFEWRFAVGAVIALTHDVLITVGVFAILGRQVTMPVVAAVLTIIGYSLNDTIVVFDRIREDMRLYRGKGHSFMEILNIAINATLSRTLLTSLTTLFVVLVLFFFGGSAINDFALALIIGVVVGTYSSIFIASPAVYFLHKMAGKHEQPTDTGSGRAGGRYIKSKKKSKTETEEAPA
jgi:SecD/SecF fusion protein